MVRVGAVNYLNTKPLIEDLDRLASEIRLTLDLPSRLADQLKRNELDVALIPVVELFRGGGYTFIPDCCISSSGPVLSVTVFSRVPWADIRTVSLDEGSRTSAALTKLLLSKREQPTTETTYCLLPIEKPADDLSTDAVLLIGDRAMKACLAGYEYSYDLGKLWSDMTGLPMVWAVWAVRSGFDLGETESAFVQAKRLGQSRAGVIAARESANLGLDAGYCRRYFDTIIQYDLGDAELAGLNRFCELTTELGLIPEGVRIGRYNRPNFVQSR
jgi:chorismate dehydratase